MTGDRDPAPIVVGTLQDLSGPVSVNGQDFLRGMELRFGQQNRLGGVRGHPIDLHVLDSHYDPYVARERCRRWLEAKILPTAMINSVGADVVKATMADVLEAGVLHLFPIAGIESTYLPVHALAFQTVPTYRVAVRQAVGRLVCESAMASPKVGVLCQQDEFGQQILTGAVEGVYSRDAKLACVQEFARGTIDFAHHLARLRATGVDLLVLGTMTNEAVSVLRWCADNNWLPTVLVTPSAFTARFHEIGGQLAEGVFAVSYHAHPYEDGKVDVARWAASYRAEFGVGPSAWSLASWLNADLFVHALLKANAITPGAIAEALNKTELNQTSLGGQEIRFTKTSHLGTNTIVLSTVQCGKWRPLGQLAEVPRVVRSY